MLQSKFYWIPAISYFPGRMGGRNQIENQLSSIEVEIACENWAWQNVRFFNLSYRQNGNKSVVNPLRETKNPVNTPLPIKKSFNVFLLNLIKMGKNKMTFFNIMYEKGVPRFPIAHALRSISAPQNVVAPPKLVSQNIFEPWKLLS